MIPDKLRETAVSQLAHATEVAAICVGGFLAFGLWAGLYSGFAAWTLKEGSNVWSKQRRLGVREAVEQEAGDVAVGYATVVLCAIGWSLIS